MGKTLLSARAAFRAGCSELHALVPAEEALSLSLALPELTVHTPSDEAKLLTGINAYRTVVIGEGFGTDEEALHLLESLLTPSYSRPFLLEGDGIATTLK